LNAALMGSQPLLKQWAGDSIAGPIAFWPDNGGSS
jgi:hypothetical protein